MIDKLMNVNIKKVEEVILIILLTILLGLVITGGNSHGIAKYAKEKAEQMTTEMTLEQKVYQMFIVSPEKITGVDRAICAGEATRAAIENYPVGGIVYTRNNIEDDKQIKDMIKNTQAYSKTKLFIAIKEEGTNTGLKAMYAYRNDGKLIAKKNAKKIARSIKDLGFNLDLAPVADVWSNPQNTVVRERAYSDDFKQASKLVSAAVKGFHEGDVLCTLNRFPGEGDTSEDLNTGNTYITKTSRELKKNELKPFEAGIEAGADAVMVGHAIVKSSDTSATSEMSSMSEEIVTERLRKGLNFDGIIMTDYLDDKVVTQTYGSGEAATKAVIAGCDVLVEPENLTEAANAIVDKVNSGTITEAQINDSVERILEAKIKAGIIE